MTTPAETTRASAGPEPAVPAAMTLLLAAACGLIAANLYYAQPLIGPISQTLGIATAAAGLIVTLTQVGYGVGLLLLVPLGDVVENRRLVLCLIAADTIAVLLVATATHSSALLFGALCVGLSSVAVQVLVPYAAHLAPEATRGRMVGNVMSGLMLGIMCARPIASFLTEALSWRAVFFGSAGVMVLLALVLARQLPIRTPVAAPRYAQLLRSMGRLALGTPVLQRRALYQACLFAAFSLFWTVTPLLLAGPAFQLSQTGIALFALAGVSGAIAAPIAGRIADRGWSHAATGIAMAIVAVAFLITLIDRPGSWLSLAMLVAAGVLLDFGVTLNLVLGQRAIYSLQPEFRARLNGLYMATFFAGGAVGSGVGAWSFAHKGWTHTCLIGVALPTLAFLYYLTERRQPAPA